MNSEERKEQELADRVVELMESVNGDRLGSDDALTHELGQQLRDLPDDDQQQELDQDLRANLVTQFDDAEKVLTPEGANALSNRKPSRWKRFWAVAASLLLLGGLAVTLFPSFQPIDEVAQLPSALYTNDDVQYKHESGTESFTFNGATTTGRSTDQVLDDLLEKTENSKIQDKEKLASSEKFTRANQLADMHISLQFFNGQSVDTFNGQSVDTDHNGRVDNRYVDVGGGGFGGGGRGGSATNGPATDSDIDGAAEQQWGGANGLPNLSTGTTPRAMSVRRSEDYFSYEEASKVSRGHYYEPKHMMQFGGGPAEQYAPITENPFVTATGAKALSTFSIDVDTASYANMRRFIEQGQLPPPNAVRLEELINYFDYQYDQPDGDVPFSTNLELAGCPWNDNHRLLRIGLQGKDVHVAERPATNVVFLIDVSGSMQNQNKLPLLKRGFQMMVEQLREDDRVSIVTYAGNAGVALEPTSGDQKKVINDAIEKLTSGGSTHGSAGIEMAYRLAQQNFIAKGSNKVILATDGDLNVGVTSDDQLVKLIKQKAAEGVFLTVLGFGTGNLKDGKLEKIADNGNGVYAYIDSLREANKVLVQQLSAALLTIAKDVKLQIEFNPAEVKSYRLLGYENRALKTEDFDNDRKDAGEIGAGHSVTALYEIVPAKMAKDRRSATPVGLKYQDAEIPATPDSPEARLANLPAAAKTGELATVAVRYKLPDAQTSQKLEFAIKNQEKSFVTASEDFRFAASVAAFGMLLRGSAYSGDATFDQIEDIGAGAMGADASGYRAEFIDLVRKAAAMSDRR